MRQVSQLIHVAQDVQQHGMVRSARKTPPGPSVSPTNLADAIALRDTDIGLVYAEAPDHGGADNIASISQRLAAIHCDLDARPGIQLRNHTLS